MKPKRQVVPISVFEGYVGVLIVFYGPPFLNSSIMYAHYKHYTTFGVIQYVFNFSHTNSYIFTSYVYQLCYVLFA